MSNSLIREFDSRQQLDEELVKKTAQVINDAIAERGEALLVVSGGSTPRHFFALLSAMPLPWEKVTVTLADERWVEVTNEDSNQKFVGDHLLINCAEKARFIPLMSAAVDAEEGALSCDCNLSTLRQFDLLILGMGVDGHTASLFPGADHLELGMDISSGINCVSIEPLTAHYQRLTMTLPRLLNSKEIIIHITGAEKRSVLQSAQNTKNQLELPISAVLQQSSTAVTVFWAE